MEKVLACAAERGSLSRGETVPGNMKALSEGMDCWRFDGSSEDRDGESLFAMEFGGGEDEDAD